MPFWFQFREGRQACQNKSDLRAGTGKGGNGQIQQQPPSEKTISKGDVTLESKGKALVVMLIAMGGIVLAATGLLDRAAHRIGLGELERVNQRYLEDSYDRALEGFLVLSAVKSGLAVIEGSEVGIGFSLQIGDLVQSVYDYVNIAWKTVLAGGTILLITRLALEGVALVDHFVLALAFFALLLLAGARGFLPGREGLAAVFKTVAISFSFVAGLLYLVLPLAVLGASSLSFVITKPLIQESYAAFSQMRHTFVQSGDPSTVGELADDASTVESAIGLGQRYERLKKRLRELEAYLGSQAKRMAGTTFQLIAGYLFDCVIFPLAFLAVLTLLLKGVPGYLFRMERERRLIRTIREAVLPAAAWPRPEQ